MKVTNYIDGLNGIWMVCEGHYQGFSCWVIVRMWHGSIYRAATGDWRCLIQGDRVGPGAYNAMYN
jgi:hypothetical protein